MKFGQLTYIKTWEIFSLKRHAQNVAQKLVLDLFKKSKIEHIFGSTAWNLFLLYVQVEECQNILKQRLTTCFYFILRFFKKQKEVWTESPCLIFCMTFEEKYFWYIGLTNQISLSDCIHFLRYLTICLLYCLCFSLWRHKFWNLP